MGRSKPTTARATSRGSLAAPIKVVAAAGELRGVEEHDVPLADCVIPFATRRQCEELHGRREPDRSAFRWDWNLLQRSS